MNTQTIALAIIVLSSAVLAGLSFKVMMIALRHPRPVDATRRSHQRRLRSLPEYRRMLPALRLTATLMAGAMLLDVFTSPSIAVLDWIVITLSVTGLIGTWTVDRHAPDCAEP